MKKILFVLILLVTFQSFAQGKFRGMEWGTSSTQLKSNYPDVQWETATEGKTKIFGTEDNVGGLKVKVVYYFIDNKLTAGGYAFDEEHTSDNMYYEDFISISNVLNKKYEMEMSENWNNSTFKNMPNEIGYALSLGHVEMNETYEDDYTTIVHSISSDDNGGIMHAVLYGDMSLIKKSKASQLDDF